MESSATHQKHAAPQQPVVTDPSGLIAVKAAMTHRYTLKDSIQNVFSAKFSPDGNFIAASYADGSVHIHTVFKGDRVFQPKIQAREETFDSKTPRESFVIRPIVTHISWRPAKIEDSAFQTFKAVTSDGRILSWRPEKADELETLYTSENNYYHTIDQSPDCGSKFVCAGKLPQVEIYDEETMKRLRQFDGDQAGHINKIFCTKFDHTNPNIIFSGGWDRNLNIWDIRIGGALVGSIFGPLICGDAIDLCARNYTMITGSQTVEDSLQLWDLRMYGLIKSFDWSCGDPNAASSLYSCKFIRPSKSAILACGSNKHSVKIFSTDTGQMLHCLTDMDPLIGMAPVVCVDTNPQGKIALIGSATGNIHVKNLTVTLANAEYEDDSSLEVTPPTPQELKESVHHD